MLAAEEGDSVLVITSNMLTSIKPVVRVEKPPKSAVNLEVVTDCGQPQPQPVVEPAPTPCLSIMVGAVEHQATLSTGGFDLDAVLAGSPSSASAAPAGTMPLVFLGAEDLSKLCGVSRSGYLVRSPSSVVCIIYQGQSAAWVAC